MRIMVRKTPDRKVADYIGVCRVKFKRRGYCKILPAYIVGAVPEKRTVAECQNPLKEHLAE